MKPATSFYTVVELAGYVGENDRKSGFSRAVEAWKWIDANYDDDERDETDAEIAVIDRCSQFTQGSEL